MEDSVWFSSLGLAEVVSGNSAFEDSGVVEEVSFLSRDLSQLRFSATLQRLTHSSYLGAERDLIVDH